MPSDVQNSFGASVTIADEKAGLTDTRPEILLAQIQEWVRPRIPDLIAEGTGRTVTQVSIALWMTVTDAQKAKMLQRIKAHIDDYILDARKALTELDELKVSMREIQKMTEEQIAKFADGCQKIALLDPVEEHDRLQALPDIPSDAVALYSRTAGWRGATDGMKGGLQALGLLSEGRDTPPLQIELLRRRMMPSFNGPAFENLIAEYGKLEWSTAIGDPHIRRLCSSMKNARLPTKWSCEGHGTTLPWAIFSGDDALVEKFKKTLLEYRHLLAERWYVRENTGTEERRYDIGTEDTRGIQSPISRRYDDALIDLDVIGMLVLHTYHSQNMPIH